MALKESGDTHERKRPQWRPPWLGWVVYPLIAGGFIAWQDGDVQHSGYIVGTATGVGGALALGFTLAGFRWLAGTADRRHRRRPQAGMDDSLHRTQSEDEQL